MKELGYKVFDDDSQAYNLNIIGWRNLDPDENTFSDFIAVYWNHKGFWEDKYYPATTLPGTPCLLNPVCKAGTAILVPGQYVGAYSLGLHNGYDALVQSKPVRVYRDNNRDSQVDTYSSTIETGLFGINIHKAGLWSKYVGQNSAGCQVFQKSTDFDDFMRICKLAEKHWGNSFTYTLLEFEI
jgi:hypothetical protein